jgi:hypothetical protein
MPPLCSSFRDAPQGVGPESIIPARLALGPFAQSITTRALPLLCRECGKPHARAWLWIPGPPLRGAPE